MLAIILTILKIIGIVLLAVLALILLILAIVLFVPIRYRIKADKSDPGDDIRAAAFVTYLLHILSAKVEYDNEISYCVRLFGIKIRPKKEKPQDIQDHVEEISGTDDSDAESVVIETSDNTEPEIDVYDSEYWEINDEGIEEAGEQASEEVINEACDEENEESLADKIDKILDKIISKYNDLEQKINKIRDRIRYLEKLKNDAGCRRAFDLILKQGLHLIKKIAPKKITGFIHFGFEDPATTGKVLMYLALIYPSLPRKFRIDPGWDDTDIYGKCDIKGHIALITVAVCFAKLAFNKDCRRLWRIYKKRDKLS